MFSLTQLFAISVINCPNCAGFSKLIAPARENRMNPFRTIPDNKSTAFRAPSIVQRRGLTICRIGVGQVLNSQWLQGFFASLGPDDPIILQQALRKN
jgi:hypothetical protein